jgi:AcrR family transcriptional regulator
MSTRIKKVAPVPAVRRQSYHHGNLKEAIVAAAVQLVEEGGPEKVTVREAARRAGVSSGAPFRHFPNKVALMTAVAEEAMRRFRAEILRAQEQVGSDDPLARYRAIGTAYLRWVFGNPTHFEVISARKLIDFDGSEALRRDNAEIQELMEGLLREAQRRGQIRSGDLKNIQLAARALAYGLARMHIDGHLPQWSVASDEAAEKMQVVFDGFVSGLAPPR